MIVAVVLTYAPAAGMLEECVDALIVAGGVDRVVVVDNGTAASALLSGRSCEVLSTGHNLGYAGGMNVGLRRALQLGADSIVVLNDDVVVERGWIDPLLAALDRDPHLGAVQPKLLFSGDRSGERADGTIVNSVGVEIGPDGAGRDVGHGEPDGPAFESDRPIVSFTGGAVVFRRAFLEEVGLFDERFFLYYEDVDLALRGDERGWRYACIPASRVHHRGSATVERAGTLGARLRERNRLWVLFRHRPARDIATGVWLAVRRVRYTPRGAHLRGLLTGVGGAPQRLVERRRAHRDRAP